MHKMYSLVKAFMRICSSSEPNGGQHSHPPALTKAPPTAACSMSEALHGEFYVRIQLASALRVHVFPFPQGWAGPSSPYCIHPPLHTCCSSTWFPALHTYSSYQPVFPSTPRQFVVSPLVPCHLPALSPASPSSVTSSHQLPSPGSSSACLRFSLSPFVSQ